MIPWPRGGPPEPAPVSVSRVKHRLKQIQYRPYLVDGCLVGTELTLDG
ncbi:hypothetical protein KSE_13110 [Kitasatospora setae KM-6054]|uniref:Transposase n=1 Tax=Kitasatospora setae (strain ATCC 33774 / DSM 43861 / JCM 3304 / KCC A-0304 / NBRC 14216 / KM-6054) TaxID=452652 RepID=E4N7G0_KITSK|nr:hypothetical protein KSE_13110 [Kitasatospora setae KM-6054]